jgi:hypothetical protein
VVRIRIGLLRLSSARLGEDLGPELAPTCLGIPFRPVEHARALPAAEGCLHQLEPALDEGAPDHLGQTAAEQLEDPDGAGGASSIAW